MPDWVKILLNEFVAAGAGAAGWFVVSVGAVGAVGVVVVATLVALAGAELVFDEKYQTPRATTTTTTTIQISVF